jgi:hypothetical protein
VLRRNKVFDPPEGSIFADADQAQLRHARMLPIALPCANANCKEARIYQHRKTRGHPKFCRSCSRLAGRTPFKCDGYRLPNFDTPQHAERCPRIIHLAPWQIHKRQRWVKDHPSSLFDVFSQRYRCGRCSKAAIPVGNRVERYES